MDASDRLTSPKVTNETLKPSLSDPTNTRRTRIPRDQPTTSNQTNRRWARPWPPNQPHTRTNTLYFSGHLDSVAGGECPSQALVWKFDCQLQFPAQGGLVGIPPVPLQLVQHALHLIGMQRPFVQCVT